MLGLHQRDRAAGDGQRRRDLTWLRGLTAALLGAVVGLAHAAPPARNLLIEVRQGEAAQFASPEPSSNFNSIGTSAQRHDAQSVQRLVVLNNAEATWQVGASVPMVWVDGVIDREGVRSPVARSNPQGVALRHSMVETGSRIAVRPRWPGGNAPVTVELRAQQDRLAVPGDALPSAAGRPAHETPTDGSVDRRSLLTTVQVPLGVWTTVASEGEAVAVHGPNVVASRDAVGDRRQVLQLRVTAP